VWRLEWFGGYDSHAFPSSASRAAPRRAGSKNPDRAAPFKRYYRAMRRAWRLMKRRLLPSAFALAAATVAPALAGQSAIDLDLLLYADLESHTEFLTLPHPRMHERRFVLKPLVEIAPRVVHPTLKQTAGRLLETLEDQSEVKRWCP
jgi:hypothetical protein